MRALSERDLRFALLVDILSFGRRRGTGRRRIRRSRHPEYAMDSNERPIVTEANKERVRAGVTGYGVRYVLICSVALVIVLFIAVALFARH
jgi:hypothetical protein